jgi:hypothetical protein
MANASERAGTIQFGELIQLTGPNGRPVWIGSAHICRIREEEGGSIIDMGPNWSQSVQETVAVVLSKISE